VLECKQYSLFIFWGEVVIFIIVINNEGKGRGMCEHICHRRATCTNEAKTEVGCRPKYEVSPSSANLHELVPPPFAMPIPPYNGAIFIFLEGTWTTEIKYVKKGIIVEIVDRCHWFADPRRVYLQVNNIARERAYLRTWDPRLPVSGLRGEGIDMLCRLLSVRQFSSESDHSKCKERTSRSRIYDQVVIGGAFQEVEDKLK